MERETDGWHLELVAFGSGGMRADEPLAAVSGLKELRQVPLKREDWEHFRFELEFESEELRQKWIAAAGHQRVWPPVERTMTTVKDYPVVLYDEV
jgi:hypothetical protein